MGSRGFDSTAFFIRSATLFLLQSKINTLSQQYKEALGEEQLVIFSVYNEKLERLIAEKNEIEKELAIIKEIEGGDSLYYEQLQLQLNNVENFLTELGTLSVENEMESKFNKAQVAEKTELSIPESVTPKDIDESLIAIAPECIVIPNAPECLAVLNSPEMIVDPDSEEILDSNESVQLVPEWYEKTVAQLCQEIEANLTCKLTAESLGMTFNTLMRILKKLSYSFGDLKKQLRLCVSENDKALLFNPGIYATQLKDLKMSWETKTVGDLYKAVIGNNTVVKAAADLDVGFGSYQLIGKLIGRITNSKHTLGMSFFEFRDYLQQEEVKNVTFPLAKFGVGWTTPLAALTEKIDLKKFSKEHICKSIVASTSLVVAANRLGVFSSTLQVFMEHIYFIDANLFPSESKGRKRFDYVVLKNWASEYLALRQEQTQQVSSHNYKRSASEPITSSPAPKKQNVESTIEEQFEIDTPVDVSISLDRWATFFDTNASAERNHSSQIQIYTNKPK